MTTLTQQTQKLKRLAAATAVLAAGSLSLAAMAQEIASKPLATGDEPRVDNPVDAWMIAYSETAGKPVAGPADKPYAGFPGSRYHCSRYDIMDGLDTRQGNFSILFTVDDPADEQAFGFWPGPYIDHWELSPEFTLRFQARCDATPVQGGWRVAIHDAHGKRLHTALDNPSIVEEWRQFAIPLKELKGDAGFDFAAIQSVQVEAQLAKGATIRLDDLYFQSGEAVLGVSDKTITQYMTEADATRPRRVEEAMSKFCGPSRQTPPLTYYWKGQVEEGNQATLKLIDEWSKGGRAGVHTMAGKHSMYNHLNQRRLYFLYFAFSAKGRIKPGLMSEEAEKAVLDAMWINTEFLNTLDYARRSPWYIIGSNNHDYSMRIRALLTSQIFKDEPGYRDRVYPNLGGSLFNRRRKAAAMAADADGKLYQEDAAELYKPVPWWDRIEHEGETYTPADHYQAWVASWKEYFAERARWGFGNEWNATGYSEVNVPASHTVYNWAEDEDLRRQARMFQDLIWAQYFQDEMLMLQGGAATRGGPGEGITAIMAQFLLGGPAHWRGMTWRYALSDYQWPRVVWEMALADRQGKGEYAFVSRKPNEEEMVSARTEGTQDSMLLRHDARIERYSWITPAYIMGVRMDHPRALYSHIFGSRQGIIFPSGPAAMVRLPGVLAVQHRNVAMFQGKIDHSMQPMPLYGPYGYPDPKKRSSSNVSFTGMDRVEEKDGWVFMQERDAYVALRVVSLASDKSDVYDSDGYWVLVPTSDNYTLAVNDRGAGSLTSKVPGNALVVEASRKAHHPTLAAFQADVLDNPLKLRAVHKGQGFLLSYRGSGDAAEEVWMNCISQTAPKIGGEYVDYNPPAFDSPYLHGASGSGVVTLTGPISGDKLVFDFNKIEIKQESAINEATK